MYDQFMCQVELIEGLHAQANVIKQLTEQKFRLEKL